VDADGDAIVLGLRREQEREECEDRRSDLHRGRLSHMLGTRCEAGGAIGIDTLTFDTWL
jgi:hypothetical protein